MYGKNYDSLDAYVAGVSKLGEENPIYKKLFGSDDKEPVAEISYHVFKEIVKIGCNELGINTPPEEMIKKSYKELARLNNSDYSDKTLEKHLPQYTKSKKGSSLWDGIKRVAFVIPGLAVAFSGMAYAAAHSLKDPKKVYHPADNVYWEVNVSKVNDQNTKDPKKQNIEKKVLHLNKTVSPTNLPSLNDTAKYIWNNAVKELYNKVKENTSKLSVVKIIPKCEGKGNGWTYNFSSEKKVTFNDLVKSIEKVLGFKNNTKEYVLIKEVPFHIAQYNQTSGKIDEINGTMTIIESSKYSVMPNITIFKHKNLVPWSNGKKTDYILSSMDFSNFKKGVEKNATEMYKAIMEKIKPNLGIQDVYKTLKRNATSKMNETKIYDKVKDLFKNKFEETGYIVFDPYKNTPRLQGYEVKDVVILKFNNTKSKLAEKLLGIYQSVKGGPSFTLSNKITEFLSLFGGNRGYCSGSSGSTGGFGGGGGSGTGGSMES